MKIGQNRIAVLIGKNGETKKDIEDALGVQINLDSKTGDCEVRPLIEHPKYGVLNTFIAEKILNAINRGFNPTKAMKLLDETDKKIRKSKEFSSIDQLMIAFETKLIFLLIGYMPHRIKDTINKKENWILDAQRKIIYSQDIEQKRNVIYDLTDKEPFRSKMPTRDELRNIYWKKCNSDPNIFVEWFMIHYTGIYLKIF